MKELILNQQSEKSVSQETSNTTNQKGSNMKKENQIIKGTKIFLEVKNSLELFYRVVKKNGKEFKKSKKKEYKNLLDNMENNFEKSMIIQTLKGIFKENSSLLLGDILGYMFDTSSGVYIDKLKKIDYRKLFNDKNFVIFYRNMYIYKSMVENNFIKDLVIEKIFDLRSLVLIYFFITEKNITENKVLNILTYFFKHSIITLNEEDKTEENNEKSRLITTGIKYEKVKVERSTDDKKNAHKEKSKKFNLLQYISTRITIKYVSNKEYRHIFHKRPIEHERKGHYRLYKDGKKVWVKSMVINFGIDNKLKKEQS